MFVSYHLGMGSAELNVVGVGADADMEGMLMPLAAANSGEAYHSAPDLIDPGALPALLK